MTSVEPIEYARVLDEIKQWPLETRLGLLRDVIGSLEPSGTPDGKRGRPVAELIGLGAGDNSPPNDDRVREWIAEYRLGKHA